MAKIDKLIEKMCRKPTPRTFRWDDLKTVLEHFGYVLDASGGGSHFAFINSEDKHTIYAVCPHPGNEVKPKALSNIVRTLKERGKL